VLISKLSSPSNTACWASRKVQLVEPWPLFQEIGCWALMAKKWEVEDLVNVGAHLL